MCCHACIFNYILSVMKLGHSMILWSSFMKIKLGHSMIMWPSFILVCFTLKELLYWLCNVYKVCTDL